MPVPGMTDRNSEANPIPVYVPGSGVPVYLPQDQPSPAPHTSTGSPQWPTSVEDPYIPERPEWPTYPPPPLTPQGYADGGTGNVNQQIEITIGQTSDQQQGLTNVATAESGSGISLEPSIMWLIAAGAIVLAVVLLIGRGK